jgi:hypothetical protein
MPWMDTRAGPIELLIGLDNTQWLPVHLEDSRDQSVNMRLMKSAFGHHYMIMGGWGTAFYPRDESMRFRGDPSGGRLSHAEMARKVRLERCIGGRLHLGTRDGGRAAIRGPSPSRERAVPDYGPVGSRRPQQPRGGAPPPIRMPFNPPPAQALPGRGGRGRGGTVRPPQPQGQPFPDPRGMPGLLQPPRPVDPMQRLALMMAVMVLGMPQVHSCHISTSPETMWSGGKTGLRVCPPIASGHEMGITAVEEQLDPNHWRKLPAVHCQATQSVLSFRCGIDGRTREVRYEKFRQPCGLQPAACWEALRSNKLKVGEQEYATWQGLKTAPKAGSCRPDS